METLQENEYVTREIHDLQLERIELLIERNIARQEAMYEGLRADIAELRGEVKAIDAKVDGLEKKIDEKINSLEKKVDEKINGLEKKVDEKINGLEKKVDERINGLEKKVDERINSLEKKVDERVNGLEKKVDARVDGIMDAITLTNMRIDDLKNAQANNLTKWGIIFAIGICTVQIIASVILHFWK